MGDQPITRPLPTQHNTKIVDITSMPQRGFIPMIVLFQWPKTIHALDHKATGNGISSLFLCINPLG
jgi:hypothetical protein